MRSRERARDLGEVFTPKRVVDEMIAAVPNSVWADPMKTVLEPTCGDGAFVLAVVRKKISLGVGLEDAIAKVYGMDVMADNVFQCREQLFDLAKEHLLEKFRTGSISRLGAEIALTRIVDIVEHNIRRTENTLKENVAAIEPWRPDEGRLMQKLRQIQSASIFM